MKRSSHAFVSADGNATPEAEAGPPKRGGAACCRVGSPSEAGTEWGAEEEAHEQSRPPLPLLQLPSPPQPQQRHLPRRTCNAGTQTGGRGLRSGREAEGVSANFSARAPAHALPFALPPAAPKDKHRRRRAARLPCCRAWPSCEARGACAFSARSLRRIHDEDLATVDVVATQQFGDDHAFVAYKRYEACGPAVDELVRSELALLRQMAGRAHTIELLDTFRDSRGDAVLVFPYIPDRRPEEPAEIRSYGRQLFEALAFLHDDLGVMHRNVKRANILWDGKALSLSASRRARRERELDSLRSLIFSRLTHVLAVDFECVVPVTAAPQWLPRAGNNVRRFFWGFQIFWIVLNPESFSQSYRAPEVAAAKPPSRHVAAACYAFSPVDGCLTPAAVYGPASDVFSAGAVLAELVLGLRRLFSAEYLEEDYDSLRRGLERYTPGGDSRGCFQSQLRRGSERGGERLTPSAADLLRRLLCWAPEGRPAAAEARLHPYLVKG